jgi:hypothetical protein
MKPVRVAGPVRLGPKRRVAVYSVAAGVWLTGLVWLVFHYGLRRQGEFGLETNPAEPWWLKLHGAFAFGALWAVGMLSAAHFPNGWASGRRRWSGAILFAAAILLIVTGYLLYYLGDERLRQMNALIHWVLGLASALPFLVHRFLVRIFQPRPEP